MILLALLLAQGNPSLLKSRICDKASAVQCLSVNSSGAASITGAVTQSTSPWVTQDNHTTAGAPLSCELSTGAAFYTAAQSTQFPAALDGSGFLKVHEQGSATVAQATGTNLHAVLDSGSTTACTQATGTNLHAVLDTTSTTAVTQATAANLNATVVLAAGSALAGKVGIDQTTVGTTNAVVPIPTTASAAALSQKAVSVNTTTNVKASAGNVYGVACANANASVCWVQFYNTASTPTCGTSVIWSIPIATSGVLNYGPGALALANHATGIGMCMGTTATGATACTTANSCTIFYQ